MVLSADCLPVALGCEGAVAMVHAGWRGLAAGVLEEGVAALRELGGRGAIEAVIGPCAGGCCYEVGPEVHARARRAAPAGGRKDGPARDRAPAAAGGGREQVARRAGVHDLRRALFSHRREGAPRDGRRGSHG